MSPLNTNHPEPTKPAPRRPRARAWWTAAITASTITLTGCHTTSTTPASTAATVTVAAVANDARAVLEQLPVRGEDTGAHYRRAQWGDWSIGPDRCDTRARILRRDAAPGTIRTGPGCRVLAGRWSSPYDGQNITRPVGVQIDHRVPLAEAARSGARGWTPAQRARFYNDPANLLAVSARSNTSKGDRDPARWRPPNRAVWCDYAAGYIATKHTYRLTVDPAERDALAAMLRTCPGVAR